MVNAAGLSSLSNGHLRLDYDCARGEFQLLYAKAAVVVLKGAHAGITLEDGTEWRSSGSSYASSHVAGNTLHVQHEWGPRLTLFQQFTLQPEAEHLLIKLVIANNGDEPVRLKTMRTIALGEGGYLKLGADPLRCHVYTNPYYKTPTSLRDVIDGFDSRIYQEGHTHGIRYLDREHEIPWHSTFDGVIYDPAGKQCAVFGFTSCHRFLPQIEIKYDRSADADAIGTFTLLNRCEGRACGAGQSLESETAYFYTGFDADRGQLALAERLGSEMRAVKLERPMSGWCSWHYAFFHITEDDIERNLKFAADRPDIFTPEPGGFEYVLIDYGWQQSIGSPRVNERQFPGGMKRLADRIRQQGFKPGIWIAPFWIEGDADLVTEHPEYLLRDGNGELLRGHATFQSPLSYRLDVSHPGARQYVLAQLDQLVNEWGYDLVKMDFLETATVTISEERSGVRYCNDELTSIEHLRSMCVEMQQFVDRSGRDIWLSPCGSPALTLAGIFKSNFVAEDAIIRFLPDKIDMHGGVKVFAETLALRRYLHGNIWTNNYESVILREPRPYKEARINATSAGLAGGVIFIGDDLSLLGPDRLQLYARMLPIYPVQARSLDLFDTAFSEQWLLEVVTAFDTWWVAAVFNWEHAVKDIVLRLPADGPDPQAHYLLFDFWEQRTMGLARGGVAIPNVPEQDCKVVCIRAHRSHPWLLSTDYHLTQGAVEIADLRWDEAERTLCGRFVGRRHGQAVLTFSVTESCRLGEAECAHAVAETAPGIVRLKLNRLDGGDRPFKLIFHAN